MSLRFANHLKEIPDYIPGKPIEEVERELGIKDPLKMASNENFASPPTAVSEAISGAIRHLNLYPDSECFSLRNTLGKKYGVHPDQIIVGNGSNYLIELICRCVLNPGDEGITCEPTFPFYRRAVRGAIGNCTSIPLKEFDVDLEGVLDNVSQKTRVIFLASPNNPTGKIIPFLTMKGFMNRLRSDIFVIFDEAYFEFVESDEVGSALTLLKDHENMVVLRTFSKIYSLAGLRIGYAVSHPTIIKALLKLFLPFNVSSLAQVAALAYLGEEGPLNEIKRVTAEGKRYFYKELTALGIEFIPTEANFILLRIGGAAKAYAHFLRRGIILRDMTPWKLPDHLRVTISTPANNERFIRELQNYLKGL
jgi:histidinol-phosphate aminotransferase